MFVSGNSRAVFFCMLLCIGGTRALARVDNNWQHRRPNVTTAHAGYRPAYQQPPVPSQTQWQRNILTYNNNQTQHGQQQHYNRPSVSNPYPGIGFYNQTHSTWQQGSTTNNHQYATNGQGGLNQTRPVWQQPSRPNYSQYPANVQGVLNQTRPAWPQPGTTQRTNYPQYPGYGQRSINQTRPIVPQAPNYPQHPAYGQGSFNQTRPLILPAPNHPQYPGQGVPFNQTRPFWPQPSAPQAPVYPIPANSNKQSAIPSWTLSANQTNLYPKLPTQNLPQPPAATGNSGIALAPLQPAPQSPQGPQNWHSGGQAVLSYGPGYYSQPSDNSNKNPPNHQGSSNPYANMFN